MTVNFVEKRSFRRRHYWDSVLEHTSVREAERATRLAHAD
jgi:hypothetical protein